MHGLACKQGGKGLGIPVWIYAGLARATTAFWGTSGLSNLDWDDLLAIVMGKKEGNRTPAL